jgi:hypothetical protein
LPFERHEAEFIEEIDSQVDQPGLLPAGAGGSTSSAGIWAGVPMHSAVIADTSIAF